MPEEKRTVITELCWEKRRCVPRQTDVEGVSVFEEGEIGLILGMVDENDPSSYHVDVVVPSVGSDRSGPCFVSFPDIFQTNQVPSVLVETSAIGDAGFGTGMSPEELLEFIFTVAFCEAATLAVDRNGDTVRFRVMAGEFHSEISIPMSDVDDVLVAVGEDGEK